MIHRSLRPFLMFSGLFVEVLLHDKRIFNGIRIIVLPLTQYLKSETFIKPDSSGIRLPDFQKHTACIALQGFADDGVHQLLADAASRMPRVHCDVVDLGVGPSHVKDHKSSSKGSAGVVFDFRKIARCESFIVDESVVAVFGPVRQVCPGSLNLDDSPNVRRSDFSDSNL
jgi:hypothetical protein